MIEKMKIFIEQFKKTLNPSSSAVSLKNREHREKTTVGWLVIRPRDLITWAEIVVKKTTVNILLQSGAGTRKSAMLITFKHVY